jgi:hypothetical protein
MNKEEREYIAQRKREYGSPLKGKLLEDTRAIANGDRIRWFLNDVASRIDPEEEYKLDLKLQVP